MADFKSTMTALDGVVGKLMASPTVQGLAAEQTWDALARTSLFRTLARGNAGLANIPGILLLILGDVTKAGGYAGLNSFLDTVSHELVTRARKPEYLLEAADRALKPDGLRVVLDSRPKVVVAHLKGCVMAPSTKAPKRPKGATGPDPSPDGEEMGYGDAKGLPTFRWAPCCDPDIAFKSAKADENKMDAVVRIGPGPQPGTNEYHEARCTSVQPAWPEMPLGEALSRRYPVAECCHRLFGDGRRIREQGSRLVDWAIESITNPTPPAPEPPPAPGWRGAWERISRSRLNPFGS